MWKGFSEKIIAWISKFKAVKHPGVSIKVIVRSMCIGVWGVFPEILLFVTLLLIDFVMVPANSHNMENIFLIELK